MKKDKRQLLNTNERYEVGATIRSGRHLWVVLSCTERPDETERYEYLLERWHA